MALDLGEFRLAARTLRLHPVFTAVAVLSLGLAIGLNTAMYSMLDALIRPNVAMRAPDQLYLLNLFGDMHHRVDATAKNQILRSDSLDFEALTGSWRAYQFALLENGSSYRTGTVAFVAPNYFSVLGVSARSGRLLGDADLDAPVRGAVISDRLARELYPGEDTPVGRPLMIEGETWTVVGVVDRASDFPGSRTVAWVLPPASDLATRPLNLARIRGTLSPQQLTSHLAVLSNRMASLADERYRDDRVAFGKAVNGQFQIGGFQFALMGAVIAVLLVACANLANLQLARGIARSRELATRAALGASRRDIIRHLVLETALTVALGLILGLLLFFWTMDLLRAAVPPTIGQYVVEPQISWRVFAFSAGLTVVAVLLIGVLPAIRVSRVNLNELIKRGAGVGSTRSARRQYGFLVAAEVAFALLVVCWGSLLLRAAGQYAEDAATWDETRIAVAKMSAFPRDGEPWRFANVAADLISRVKVNPDVEDAAVSSPHRIGDGVISTTDPSGRIDSVFVPLTSYLVVTPSYLHTMHVAVVRGRDFRAGEQGPVAIVAAPVAEKLWPHVDPIGQMVKFGSLHTPGRWYTVVGVRGGPTVKDYKIVMGDVAEVLPTDDDDATSTVGTSPRPVELYVQARRAPQRVPVFLRQLIAADHRVSAYFVGTLDEWTGATAQVQNHKFVGGLFAAFAIVAIALAALGVYGIVSYSVAERRREIGVRLALGASARDIIRAVVREGNVFILTGVAGGLLFIRQAAILVRQFLYFPEIDIYSVDLYMLAAVAVVAVAVIAALVPALRATQIDPAESLHCE